MHQPSVLFLNCGAICYDSTLYFERQINAALQNRGWHTETLSVDKKNPAAALKRLYDRQYDVIFDINTILPAAADESGSFCLDRIGGELWHYILDHPFYHHDTLKCPLQHYNVLCLDENHAAFIRKYYPHIRRIAVLPLAASSAGKIRSRQDRQNQNAVIFTGTYTNSDFLLQKAMKQPADLAGLFQDMIQMLFDHPDMTQEEAVSLLLPEHVDRLPEILRLNYLADLYLQACLREELLKQFLLQRIPVTVYGHGWEIFAQICSASVPDVQKNLHIAGEFPYTRMPEIYENAGIALNQTPWFKAGMHDRVPLALQNGCVCLTERCPYLEKRLSNGQELYYYSLEDMEGAALLAKHLLTHPEEADKTAARAAAYAARYMGWDHWTDVFLSELTLPDAQTEP